MAALFTAQYQWLWAIGLGAALFLPVRQVIWVLSVRRLESRHGTADDAARQSLKRRAGVTAALLCALFAYLYIQTLFAPAPTP